MAFETFDTARMRALKQYANLEYELSWLLSGLLGGRYSVASAIFYRISNTRARYSIIEALFEINNPTFLPPWAKLESWLNQRDTARNHIVHWGHDWPKRDHLHPRGPEPPRLVNRAKAGRSDGKFYDQHEIVAEFEVTRKMTDIINAFRQCFQLREGEPLPSWLHIFQQPIADRKPEEFLQRLIGAGYEAPPPTWPV